MTIKIEKFKSVKDLPNPLINKWEEIYWSIWRVWDKAYWYVYYLFNPQHKSIRKAIPRAWRDLDSIVEDVLSAVIISFVEDEKGLDQIEMILDSLGKDDEYLIKEWGSVDLFWDYYNARYADYLRLQAIYTWVKSGKKAMQNYLDSIEGTNNWQEYSKVEHDIHERDSEYLADLVRLRKYLWT
jgi:hypothetical protein